jgi:hypothetical protein
MSKDVVEETLKGIYMYQTGYRFLALGKRDLQYKSHNKEFKKEPYKNEEDILKVLVQAVVTRVNSGIAGKSVAAVFPKREYLLGEVQKFQNGEDIHVEFDEFTADFPFEIFDSIHTVGAVASNDLTDPKFKLAYDLITPHIKYKERVVSKQEIEDGERAYYLWETTTKTYDAIMNGICFGDDKIMKENKWAHYSERQRLKDGVYYTPKEFRDLSEKMIKEYFGEDKVYWDPCSGDGRLLENFENKYLSDIATIPNIKKNDFIKSEWEPCKNYIIYTNPGFPIAIKFLEKCLRLNKPFACYIPDYCLPTIPLPVVKGFYTTSLKWDNLPENNSDRNQGFGIVFLIFDPRIKPYKDSIYINDIHTKKERILEITPPDDQLYLFKGKTPKRYHAQEYAYDKAFVGKKVKGINGTFVRESQITDICYFDGKPHYVTPKNEKSIKKIFYTEEQFNEFLRQGGVIGRKQKISKNRRKSN